MAMTDTATTPRVWIGCLNAYNCGHLHGEWVDATLGEEHLQEAAARVIKTSPGDSPEEIFLADNEGFGGFDLGEYAALDRVAEIAEAIEEHGAPFLAYVGLGIHTNEDVSEIVDAFEEAYAGEADSEKDFAYQLVDDTGMLSQVDDSIAMYFDYDAFAHDLFMGDYTYSDGYVFRNS